jgi:hypothetical protein
MAISRTWYNTLVDDSGSNLDGTVIDKADFDAILDAIDVLEQDKVIVPGLTITLSNGRNDNVVIGATSNVHAISGPTAAFGISGIVAGSGGQWVTIHHNSGQVLTIHHSNANSTAANRIYCPGSVDKTTSTTFGTAILIYNSLIPGWVLYSIM